MNYLDIAFIAVIALSVVFGMVRGFIRESLSLAAWILAIWVAVQFSSVVSPWLEPFVDSPLVRDILAVAGLFLLTLIVASIASFLLYKLFAITGITGTDRILGAAFGVARGALVIAVVVGLGSAVQLQREDWWSGSLLVPQFQWAADRLFDLLPDSLESRPLES